MDNRIPSIINDLGKDDNPEEVKGYNHLAFTDWINAKEHLAKDWTIVAKTCRVNDNQNYTTISCFASPANNETRDILFARESWEIDSEFGIPSFYGEKDGEWEFRENVELQVQHAILKPFVLRRNFHSYIPNRFEIVQHFLFYYGAFWVEDKKEYQMIEKNGDLITIAKHTKNSDVDELVIINTNYLRNYLAMTKSYLVRFHDHRRQFKDQMPFKRKNSSHRGENCSYIIEVYNNNFMDGYLSHSRLLGKDVIKPFEKPSTRFTFDTSTKDYVNFIYGVTENGESLEYTCREDNLSSYFTDKGAPHFLTPVYFNKSVLLKYYSEPKRFTVTSHHFSCLSLWGIDIDITKEGLVHVWLGDLGRLPLNEQLHWKQYNVQPRGTISQHRFAADFENKFSAPSVEEHPIGYLLRAYNELNSLAEKKYSGKIFLDLTKKDDHYLKIVRVPLTEEWKEFDEQIQALAKIFCDSINVKLLEIISNKKIDNKEIKGSISLFHVLLDQIGIDAEKINLTIEALQAIQSIRSTGAAHRKGEKFEQSLEKYKLNNLTNEDKIKQIAIKLYNGLKSVLDHLQ